jgi:hypothetical protein
MPDEYSNLDDYNSLDNISDKGNGILYLLSMKMQRR